MQARHQADGVGQFCGFGVWAGVLAALDPAAVGRAQGGGEADPAGELAADRLPTGAEARLRQAFAQHVHAGLGVARRMLAVGLDPDRGGQLRWGQEYVDEGEAAYEERYRQRTLANLKTSAKDLGYRLVPNTPSPATPEPVSAPTA